MGVAYAWIGAGTALAQVSLFTDQCQGQNLQPDGVSPALLNLETSTPTQRPCPCIAKKCTRSLCNQRGCAVGFWSPLGCSAPLLGWFGGPRRLAGDFLWFSSHFCTSFMGGCVPDDVLYGCHCHTAPSAAHNVASGILDSAIAAGAQLNLLISWSHGTSIEGLV